MHIYDGAPEEKAHEWTISQVKSILKEETYIGNSVHNKQTNISYKNKKKVRKSKDEWYTVENTHEAIISTEVFQQVQEQIANRRRRQKDGTTQIFSGLVKCADCGWSLAYGVNTTNKTPYAHYHCSKYGQGLHQCSMHYIRYDVLYAYVLSRLQYWSQQAVQDEGEQQELEEKIRQLHEAAEAAAQKIFFPRPENAGIMGRATENLHGFPQMQHKIGGIVPSVLLCLAHQTKEDIPWLFLKICNMFVPARSSHRSSLPSS